MGSVGQRWEVEMKQKKGGGGGGGGQGGGVGAKNQTRLSN